MIPKQKKQLSRLSCAVEADEAILGHLLFTAQRVAREQGLESGGFRVVINNGNNGGQSVQHLHLHVLGLPCLLYTFTLILISLL